MLHIANASKSFGSVAVLNNINLTLEEHQILGLAGPSGSGKSTLLRCIQQLENLSSGSIKVAGQSGFMFQDFQLFPHMSVLKNLTYAPQLHNKKQKKSKAELASSIEEIQENALSMLDTLGIKNKASCLPHQLSGGQKQRVALARSLMMSPSLLLCDEPTSGLDTVITEEISSLLKSVQAMGVTMVIASHDLAFLTQVADRLVVLKGGNLITDVKPTDFTNPIDYLKQQLSGANHESSN
ncbi:amino acid ABC transporter ATP-binding protein [Legionella fallonii]|uniref:Arginine transport ATP-binding protein ArtM n=1 Tax=Legionella fallonii LLAP-10 TaxID=1212491 RepID=A0A098G0X7_9GAMM|nr:ATP-binding cassette domain-containing protein [Legionella fallonii]CEG55629.1 Arginine transport ATP-binding protein ArtM [Legionella fallonii LLAP-10]